MTRAAKFRFRLYIAGDTANSTQAIANLNAICKTYMPGQYSVEIIDVLREPKRALEDNIMMTPTLIMLTPTLIKATPSPAMRVIGNLSQTEIVLRSMGLEMLVT